MSKEGGLYSGDAGGSRGRLTPYEDVHAGLAFLLPNFFSTQHDYFTLVTQAHQLQPLTMGGKPDTAFRSGIYLTPVEEVTNAAGGGEELKFHLLRCSTNLSGPTENFGAVDYEIVNSANAARLQLMAGTAELNHVLAQSYHNTAGGGNKGAGDKKARIAEHSDKTKDMPANGLLAFCSFYQGLTGEQEHFGRAHKVGHDYVVGSKHTTVLTKLRFRLKHHQQDPSLPTLFDITLYPHSLLLVSLRTNRLYTHEIVPSALPVVDLPTRLGYVIRCSNTEAVHTNGQTFLLRPDGTRVALAPRTTEGVAELRSLYLLENTTSQVVDYRDRFPFSMNDGDYLKPVLSNKAL